MITFRKNAIERALNRSPKNSLHDAKIKISDLFGCNVFSKNAMKQYLSEEAYRSIMESVNKGTKIEYKLADQIATAMKTWALSRGATHYTHWFQPLTGATAEKHDAFITILDELLPVEKFEGSQLIQQEPDASSFPSGGIRATFEARGYSAWDPTSPAFIIGDTLCIPSIFISYTGDALDYKTPLIKALSALDKAAVEVCQYFDKNVSKVYATLGWEQEYFLVDEALYHARPDLMAAGRTLFGHEASKGQQLEDHYFGSINERVLEFMKDFEIEAWKLGIPVKTRHNEVAPNQFELAPIFEETNLANDHNQLVMDLMEKTARRHNLRILFHEKPFAGVNGSGKHNNWSLATDTGKNLLSPGKTPKTNLQFLSFFINVIKAVHDYADLLRASIASAGNDHRLGANEAPPAIMSIFIGSQLTSVLDEILKKVKKGKMSPDLKTELKLNIGKIPQIIFDNTDRNRTSPFAFTGSKFEFRAVGSSANCSASMIALNTIMAHQLTEFKKDVDALIDAGLDKDEAIFNILRNYILASKNILFEGNGYSEEWVREAEKRGLSNIKTTPQALKEYISEKTASVFTKMDVMTARELHARYLIKQEKYYKKIQIEARVLGDLAINHIIPTALKYQSLLLDNVSKVKELFGNEYIKIAATQINSIQEISAHIAAINKKVHNMIEARKKANVIEDEFKHALAYSEKVKPFLDDIRLHVDTLELMIDDELWPLPKYRELLYI
ncbi:MAG: glutamine synthetase [Bacteroidetes bacterium RIFOXYA12_FULL_35_11]|nr:MAG: glutamine synthetase [Bacteroidetes bacterium GWF2_35_48]OFY72644.1 MAG: glutamine synthetase [Bacteroidetes bacterium RIFOXYA12_FULL_35_11]OFY96168.1 MAG: glutamine synthetase [Bacteroidetes bacterium RIFOXYB2_FULL_35_7]HBX50151.1 glutamine synthetase type III [Bacteroidales bacterium]